MLAIAKGKGCYSNLFQFDLTKPLPIPSGHYGAVLSAGTFTHGHLGPKVFDEVLRLMKPGGIFVGTIHSEVFIRKGFEAKIKSLSPKILGLVIQEMSVYGQKTVKELSDEKVLMTVFRKAS